MEKARQPKSRRASTPSMQAQPVLKFAETWQAAATGEVRRQLGWCLIEAVRKLI